MERTALASARGQHWGKRRARDRRRAGTGPGANASDRADLRSAHYPAPSGKVAGWPEATPRKLDSLLWPQRRFGDGAVGEGRGVPRHRPFGFLYTRAGERVVLPNDFQDAAPRTTSAVCRLGCRHCHLLEPSLIATDRTEEPNALDGTDERSAMSMQLWRSGVRNVGCATAWPQRPTKH